MQRIVFKRCSVTFDLGTIKKCKDLAIGKGLSVSALLRLLVADAAGQAKAAKRARTRPQDLLENSG